jgi:hypothetical protein
MTVDPKDLDEVGRLDEEEHADLLAKVKGWIRTRRFILAEGNNPKSPYVECLALHDYASDNRLVGPEHIYAMSTPWRNKVITWRPCRNRTIGPNAHKGTVITNDGFPLQYRIDGFQELGAPTIILIISVLTTYRIWDHFLDLVTPHFPQHRFICYNPRGYIALPPGTKPISIDVLSDDVEYLLYRLSIPKATLVGVSMGGMTTLNFAINHPTMLENFVACDCNVSGDAAARQAWGERIALVKSPGGIEKLAEQAIVRWLGLPFV